MPLQRAALAAAALALACATVPLAAQPVWNDDRTQELVGAAINRRSVQLADTALRDYSARASGTLTFLAQLGDGFLSRPVVVKADQLELEVYWGAPDRSKQRIVGRRDTLLLPTDLLYHRDHLGIVQNNFPDIIRLGDGDEVLDVIHPLSTAGPLVYDYAIADSLIIRGTGLDLDVVMVNVRPKDPRRPAAVGAVYIDRATSSVVRMTFSFTRAALRDRQLDDVSVILENGLVDGRFWLPRRQEIEIRRSASWMDFPAKGIIRGRWEICCVETNRSLPAPLFLGHEIVEAGPPAQLRAHPAFQGSVLDAIPDDARALDDADVRAVQEEARRLVQEAALQRSRGANLSAGRISDFVRGDRVEGLAIGAGLSQRLGAGFTAKVLGRYGSADSRAKGRGSLAWQRASGWSISAEGFDDWQQLGEVAEVSGVRNTLAAQEFGSDWTQPIGAVGGALRTQWAPPGRGRWVLEYRRQDERGLLVRATPAFGTFAPTLPAQALTRDGLSVAFERSGSLGRGAAVGALLDSDWRFASRVGGSQWTARDGSAQGRVLRTSLDFEVAVPLGGVRLRSRSIAAATSAGTLPLQDRVLFGGPISGPGYEFHAFAGRAGVSQRLELQRRIPFVPINLGRFGRVPGSVVLAPFAHAVWMHEDLGGRSGWSPALGLGTLGLFDLLRVDVARGLRDGRWTFSLDLSRSLWPVL
jgi:hypothetical protein